MCRAMEEMVKETAFKTRVEAIKNMIETFNLPVTDVMKALKIPESEYDRYIAAM